MELIKLNTNLIQNALKRMEISAPSGSDYKPYSESKKRADEKNADDSIELNSKEAKTESKDETIAKKLSEKLSEIEKKSTSDILKIVNEYSPSVMKSIKAIIAQKTGLGLDKSKAPDLELLASALKDAAGSPDPSKRVADIVTGVGLVPDELKDKFLEVSQKILGMEKQAANYSLTQPSDGSIEINPDTGNYEPTEIGLGVEANFDLYFSISARQSVSYGENSDGSFYEATAEVAARFESNFSLEISGRYFSLADLAQEIDPKVLDSFSNAVKGLAGLDDEALNRFFDAAESLFDEVEESFGLSNTALDGVADSLKKTAQSFFEAVNAASNDLFPGLKLDQIFALPEELDSNGHSDLLSLLHDYAAKRDPEKDAENLLKALNAAENSYSLNNTPKDITPLEEILNELHIN